MDYEIGTVIKEIRKSKNYSQSKVSKGIMHQTNYSKFELGEIEISYDKFKKLLVNLELDIIEFEYLYALRTHSHRQNIIHYFYKLRFIDEEILNQLIKDSTKYLENNSDRFINDIHNVCKALIEVKGDNFDVAKSYGYKIWERLERSDNWYLSDIKLINSILFLFPVETAEHITEFALKQGLKYDHHPEYENIFLPFKYNLVHLLLRGNRIEEAKSLNEEVLHTFKEKKLYTQVALCKLRKGLIELHLNKTESSKGLLENAYLIAEVLNDKELTMKLKKEEIYVNSILSTNA
ncbi:helix-turn-helix domain-containing protein [Planococcus dechangensis]|uniref:Helix-turn-helix domain-containing protein n=1 Tax=Planococcus dechangensis TaxID=1176255 RepID=A0ABV9MCW2_9BACL